MATRGIPIDMLKESDKSTIAKVTEKTNVEHVLKPTKDKTNHKTSLVNIVFYYVQPPTQSSPTSSNPSISQIQTIPITHLPTKITRRNLDIPCPSAPMRHLEARLLHILILHVIHHSLNRRIERLLLGGSVAIPAAREILPPAVVDVPTDEIARALVGLGFRAAGQGAHEADGVFEDGVAGLDDGAVV